MCKAAEDYGKEREIVKAVEIAKNCLRTMCCRLKLLLNTQELTIIRIYSVA